MNYKYELNFLFDILKKCHVDATVISLQDGIEAIIDPRFLEIIKTAPDTAVGNVLGIINNNTKYKFNNEFKLQYIFVRLPITSEKNILSIGPYLSAPLSSKDILEISEYAGTPIDMLKSLQEYYSWLPILSENDKLLVMIDAFLERIWKTDAFSIVELNKPYTPFILQSDNAPRGESFEEVEAGIKMMEMRYEKENELIRAVSQGQQHIGVFIVSQISEMVLEQRASDPLRNSKNYCIIMNTLLRKAAEHGGVHPIYIDKTSSKFATRIELLPTTKACIDIMAEMISSYCRLVYKHSMKGYSPIVKKTILIIDSDISAELSLSTIAQKQGISSGYLATVFKKETQKTVSEYVIDKRIEHACYLLSSTHLQIQTVAQHCGIVDAQHFSKVFKKKTGKSPREYRKAVQH